MSAPSRATGFSRDDIARLTEFNKRFWEHATYRGGCLEWDGYRKKQGYGSLSVKVGGEWLQMTANRVAYVLLHGSIPEGLLVRHTCDNPPCILPAHLVLGTNADNMQDMIARGRSRKNVGENNSSALLTVTQVESIRARYARRDITQTALGHEYGVSQQTISAIICGAVWASVEQTYGW